MKILIEIPDSKAKSFLEIIKNMTYVKTKLISENKAEFLSDLKDSVEEMTSIKEGKLNGRPVQDLINEL